MAKPLGRRLPAYNTPSLEGPTPINRRTMPTRHVYDKDNPHEYTHSLSTDIRRTLERHRQK